MVVGRDLTRSESSVPSSWTTLEPAVNGPFSQTIVMVMTCPAGSTESEPNVPEMVLIGVPAMTVVEVGSPSEVPARATVRDFVRS